MNYDHPELRDRLAAEYVLGTLAGGARRRFERLLRDDRALQDAVLFWQRELTPLASALRTDAPPPRVWEAIAARVDPSARPAVRSVGWFERWFGVRALTGLAAGLVMGIGVTLLVPRPGAEDAEGVPVQLPATYTGILSGGDGQPVMLVNSPRHGRFADVKLLRELTVGPGQELRLWALPPAGAPIPLGSVPASGKARVALPATAEQLLSGVRELAVSVEPADAPPRAPTGAYLLRGPCAKFW